MLSNSLYGSTLHDVSKRVTASLTFGSHKISKIVKSPIFSNFIEFSPNCGLAIRRKSHVILTNPTAIAFGILSVSKLILLRGYYSIMEPAFKARGAVTSMKYSDTDSALIYSVFDNGRPNGRTDGRTDGRTNTRENEQSIETYWDALRDICHKWDHSKLSVSHPFYTSPTVSEEQRSKLLFYREKNAKVLGLFSHEAPRCYPLSGACLLKAKSYVIELYKPDGGKTEKVAMKGAKLCKLDLKYQYAMRFLLGKEKMNIIYNHVCITSRKHRLQNRTSPKSVCNRQFLKRWLLPCGIKSFSYGHYMIDVYETMHDMLNTVCKTNS